MSTQQSRDRIWPSSRPNTTLAVSRAVLGPRPCLPPLDSALQTPNRGACAVSGPPRVCRRRERQFVLLQHRHLQLEYAYLTLQPRQPLPRTRGGRPRAAATRPRAARRPERKDPLSSGWASLVTSSGTAVDASTPSCRWPLRLRRVVPLSMGPFCAALLPRWARRRGRQLPSGTRLHDLTRRKEWSLCCGGLCRCHHAAP